MNSLFISFVKLENAFIVDDGIENAGLEVVEDRCVKIEHGRLFGGLNWAGVNTKVISAKRPQWLPY